MKKEIICIFVITQSSILVKEVSIYSFQTLLVLSVYTGLGKLLLKIFIMP